MPFDLAPYGHAALESTVGVTLTHLTHRGVLSPLETVRALSTRPARILRLDAGTLRPGETPVAGIAVIDPDLTWTFDKSKTFSRSKNTPFDGASLKGKTMLTLNGGEIYRAAEFPAPRVSDS